jgi:hypothetical protein
MSFIEIGIVLGVSHQRAEQIYASGMKKLRARPEMLARLMRLVAELGIERELRLQGNPLLRGATPRTVRRMGASDPMWEQTREDLPSVSDRFEEDPEGIAGGPSAVDRPGSGSGVAES